MKLLVYIYLNKIISKGRNSPLSWIAINILEIDKYLEMIYKKEKYDKNKS